jgi:Tfp pilus assembly protein PilF
MNYTVAAEASFAKAIALKSQNPRVYYNYGLMLNSRKKFKEAEAVLQKGIAINPDTPDLYYALTFVHIQADNKAKAQQTASRLKQMDPNNPNYQELFKSLGLQKR